MSTTSGNDEQRPADQVGPLLRAAREDAGLSQPAVVRATTLSQAALSRIELGRSMPRIDPDEGIDQVAELVALYGIREETATFLAETVTDYHEAARDERFVVSRATNILSVQRRIREREDRTGRLRSFSAGLVFGTTQTPEYAAAVFRTDVDDPKVRERLRRGVQLPQNAKRHHELVMAEGGLWWPMGSPAVMAGQIDHLVEVSHLPNVDLHVVPSTVVTGLAPGPGFHIHDDGPVVLAQVDGQAELSGDHIARYVARFEALTAAALTDDAARDYLAGIAGVYRDRAAAAL